MEALLFYFLKMTSTSAVMYLYYRLFLKDKTFHHYNRFYLLFAVVVSFALPLLKISYFTIELRSDLFLMLENFKNSTYQNTPNHDYIYFQLFIIGIGLVSILLIARFLVGIIKINRFKSHYPKQEFEGINFYQTNLSEAPFSYFKNLFWKNSIGLQSEVGKQILKHEMVHIEQKHSIDKLFLEILTSVFWFNPIFHLIKKDIHLIHEYLADKKAVKNSDTKAFAQMLLASHFSGNMIPATSPFLSSNLKKRLKMLQKPTTKYSYARRILALPVVFTVAFAYMVNAKNKEIIEVNSVLANAINVEKENLKLSSVAVDTLKKPEKLSVTKGNLKIVENNKEISKIGDKIAKNAAELKKLSPESNEYKDKVEEITKLSNKISTLAKDPAYQNDLKNLDNYTTTFYFDNTNLNFDELRSRLNSPEFRNQLLKSKETLSPEDLKKMLEQIESARLDLSKLPPMPPVPPIPPLPSVKFYGNDGAIQLFNSNGEKIKNLSRSEKKQIEKAKKQIEKAREDIEKARKSHQNAVEEQRKILSKNSDLIYDYSHPNLKKVDVSSGGNTGNRSFKVQSSSEIQYFINDKPATKEEANALDPSSIKSMNIIKENSDGEKSHIIKIQLK